MFFAPVFVGRQVATMERLRVARRRPHGAKAAQRQPTAWRRGRRWAEATAQHSEATGAHDNRQHVYTRAPSLDPPLCHPNGGQTAPRRNVLRHKCHPHPPILNFRLPPIPPYTKLVRDSRKPSRTKKKIQAPSAINIVKGGGRGSASNNLKLVYCGVDQRGLPKGCRS